MEGRVTRDLDKFFLTIKKNTAEIDGGGAQNKGGGNPRPSG
jgi:hypothetical protein